MHLRSALNVRQTFFDSVDAIKKNTLADNVGNFCTWTGELVRPLRQLNTSFVSNQRHCSAMFPRPPCYLRPLANMDNTIYYCLN